jgi:hypothetical protein
MDVVHRSELSLDLRVPAVACGEPLLRHVPSRWRSSCSVISSRRRRAEA